MYQLVLCTCPQQEAALALAKQLVNDGLAACINILPEMTSVYRWQDKVEVEPEVQLVIKTTTDSFNALKQKIIELHPYDVPEIIALDIKDGDSNYLNWIRESVS